MFFEVWKMYGRFVDEAGSEAKKVLITPYAKGIVLDLGAGEWIGGAWELLLTAITV